MTSGKENTDKNITEVQGRLKRKPKALNSVFVILLGLAYPCVKYFTSESGRLLGFLDALTITGLVFILIGIFVSIYLHGDLDSLIFRMKHPCISEETSFETFRQDKDKEREDSFNYPLFSGMLFVAASFIIATFFY